MAAAATTLTDIGYISVSVVRYDVIDERDVESDEIAGDSRLSTWREDDTNLKQEMRRSAGASRGRRHIAHVPVGVDWSIYGKLGQGQIEMSCDVMEMT